MLVNFDEYRDFYGVRSRRVGGVFLWSCLRFDV